MVGDRRALATRHLRRGLLGGTRRRHLYAAVHEPVHTSETDDATNTAEVARVHLVEVVHTSNARLLHFSFFFTVEADTLALNIVLMYHDRHAIWRR